MTRREKLRAAVMRTRKAIAVAIAGSIVILGRKFGVELVNDDVQTFVDFAFVTGVVYAAPANVKEEVKDFLEDEDEDGQV